MAQLPQLPLGTSTNFRLISNANILESSFGGPSQRNAKLGDRWAVEIVCRPMKASQAGPVITALLQGLSEKLIVNVPQPGVDIGTPGNPTVSGAGQSGSSVTMTGFSPGYQIKNGQFFSIVANGVRYLHRARADVTANGTGAAVVPMLPMLKVSPPAGSVCEFAQPKIEGFVDGNEQGWTVGLVENVGLTVKIKEAQ